MSNTGKRTSAPAWVADAVAELPPLVTEARAAELLGVSRRTLRSWRAAGRLSGVKTTASQSGRVIYPRAELARFLAELAGVV